MKLTICLRALLFVAICVPYAHAQEEDVLRPHGRPISAEERQNYSWSNHPERIPISLGVYGGLNINSFSQDVEYSTLPFVAGPLETVQSTGSGSSVLFGALIDYAISPSLALQLRLEYDTKQFSNTQNGGADYYDATTQITTALPIEISYTTKANYLNIAPTFRINVNENFFISLGVPIQMLMGDVSRTDQNTITDRSKGIYWVKNFDGSSIPLSDSVLSISGTTNAPIGVSFFTANVTTAEYTAMRIGITPGVGFLYPLTRTMALAVEGRYQYMLSPMFGSWQGADYARALSPGSQPTGISFKNATLHSLQLTLGLWFKI